MPNRVQDLIIQVWNDAGKAWGSAENKRRIIAECLRKATIAWEEAPTGPQKDQLAARKNAWQTALVRSRWETKFLKSQLRPEIQRCFDTTPGSYVLPEWQVIRCRTLETFSGAVSAEAKALEASFSPNDQDLRKETTPWDVQLNLLYQALIADAYKIAGAGLWLQQQMDALKLDPEFVTGYEETFRQWDRFVAFGVNYNTYGRGCFAETEAALGSSVDLLQGRIQVANVDDVLDKYTGTENDAMKAVGGLFVLNAELLSPADAALREPDPINFR